MVRQCKCEKTIFYYQRDKRWAKEIMTQASWTDTIGEFGCLVTCLTNIIQVLMGKKFMPKDLNDIFVQDRAYKYLEDRNTPENIASVLIWDKVQKLFPAIDFKLFLKDYKEDSKAYYIGELAGRFHFVNVLAVKPGYYDHINYICYDVWDGQIRLYCKEDFDYFHVLKLKGV